MSKRVVIVGSGIIGASLAWHLTKLGAEVRVLEAASELGGVATPNSWAWINASWGNDRSYFDLRSFAMREWQRCDKEVPGLVVNWCGSLLWDLPEQKLRSFVDEHQSWGYDVTLVSSTKITEREPHLLNPPSFAAYAPGEGYVEPREAALAFLNDARRNGAETIPKARVKWLRERNGRIDGVMTSEGDIDADEVVLATGVGTNELLHSLGKKLELSSSAGLLMYTEPEPEVLTGLLITPTMEVRQARSGHLIVGALAQSDGDLQNPAELAEAMLIDLRKLVEFEVAPRMQRYAVGIRPMPVDGRPCLGRLEDLQGLYIATTHSGVTLAPAVGSLCGSEIMQDERPAALLPYAPGRLLKAN
jgi:glycine/D-amino acid oxidase-like deaminating enzyme